MAGAFKPFGKDFALWCPQTPLARALSHGHNGRAFPKGGTSGGGRMANKNKKTVWLALVLMAGAVGLSGCASSYQVPEIPDTASFMAPADPVLTSGKELRVVVFGSESLSGTYRVQKDGKLHLGPLGSMHAAGLTAQELEQRIAQALAERGMPGAQVSVLVD